MLVGIRVFGYRIWWFWVYRSGSLGNIHPNASKKPRILGVNTKPHMKEGAPTSYNPKPYTLNPAGLNVLIPLFQNRITSLNAHQSLDINP